MSKNYEKERVEALRPKLEEIKERQSSRTSPEKLKSEVAAWFNYEAVTSLTWFEDRADIERNLESLKADFIDMLSRQIDLEYNYWLGSYITDMSQSLSDLEIAKPKLNEAKEECASLLAERTSILGKIKEFEKEVYKQFK